MSIEQAKAEIEQKRTEAERALVNAKRDFSIALARRHLGLRDIRAGENALREARILMSTQAEALADLDALLSGLRDKAIEAEVRALDNAAEVATKAREDAKHAEQSELLELLAEKQRLREVEGVGLRNSKQHRLGVLLGRLGNPFDQSGALLPDWPQP